MHDYLVLASRDVAVPRTRQVIDPNDAEAFAEKLGYPCILKGIHGAEGRHVYKVDSRQQLRRRLLQYKAGDLMVQEFLPAERDYRVIVVGYRALAVYVSRKPGPDDFRTNCELNEEVTCHPLSEAPHLQEIAERASLVLRREFSGVDLRCRGTTPLVLEVNRRPGFKGFEHASHYDVAGAFIQYVADICRAKKRD
jgi:glutathione synthase/RimK-type ligase-like ATP-grasp enzyme